MDAGDGRVGGDDAISRLEERSGVEPTPIIAYTADTDERMRERCRAVGVQEVWFKPLDLKQLTLVMSELFLPSRLTPADGLYQGVMERKLKSLALNEHIAADMKHDSERIASFAQLLREDIEGELNRLNQALLLADRHQMQSAGHSLKGLCGYLHNQQPGIIARKLYMGAMDLPFTELSHLVKHLHQVIVLPPADVDQQD